jgi:hypothetical protein
MQVKRIPISQINPAPYNPRRDLQPGEPEYERLVRSIEEFGCVEPLVWNKQTGNLVGGHQRLKVLLGRGETHAEVSVVDLPLVREKALNLALNKISGDWDQERLAALLDELLKTPEFDLSLSGFEIPEATSLIAQALAAAHHGKPEDFDVAAELERQLASKSPPVTKPGDLILLGRDPRTQHRLLCGDSTDRGAGHRSDGRPAGGADGHRPPVPRELHQAPPPEGRRPEAPEDQGLVQHLRPRLGRLQGQPPALREVHRDGRGRGAGPLRRVVRLARQPPPGHAGGRHRQGRRLRALPDHLEEEPPGAHTLLVRLAARALPDGLAQGQEARQARGVVPSTVWEVDTLPNTEDRPDHPTPKPLELFDIPLRQHTRAGEVSYEPFAGSGTQIIAAQRLGRRCFALEISPVYCDLIVRRFIAFAGESAVDPKVAKRYRRQEGVRA